MTLPKVFVAGDEAATAQDCSGATIYHHPRVLALCALKATQSCHGNWRLSTA